MLLPESFYAAPDPTHVARALLGCFLVHEAAGVRTVGRITETEAYWAPDDQASHARNYRRTARTETMFGAPGTAYVYLCYGIHQLFNVVTGPEEVPHAVLVRALEPVEGLEYMMIRRKYPFPSGERSPTLDKIKPQLSAGPGVLSQAMGISTDLNGQKLTTPTAGIWIEDRADRPTEAAIVATPRIGIDYAGPHWIAQPWRFYDRRSRFVSSPR
jgi:DNA-3-methyladenine glycosylase